MPKRVTPGSGVRATFNTTIALTTHIRERFFRGFASSLQQASQALCCMYYFCALSHVVKY